MSNRIQNNQPVQGVSTVGSALSGATTGVKLSYTVPAGKQAAVRYMSVSNFTLGPTVSFQLIIGGVTVTLSAPTAAGNVPGTFYLNAGDIAQFNVTGAVAVSSFDGVISAEEFLAI